MVDAGKGRVNSRPETSLRRLLKTVRGSYHAIPVGLFDSFRKPSEGRRAKKARACELAGDLSAAVDLYLEAELPNEAARVLLLRADAEASADKRIAFSSAAANTATDEALKKRALGRKALVSLDVIRARGGPSMRSELSRIAADLESAGELERAVEVYVELGDADAEVRVLTEMGAIDRLEERLKRSASDTRKARAIADVRRRVTDLDKTAERRAALEAARAHLAEHEDEIVSDAARGIRARLVTAPVVDLEIEGKMQRVAFGADVTIGRGDATILVAARPVSRTHVRVRRAAGDVVVEDLDTRNGTMLAGARIDGPIPVGKGLRIELGGEVPCTLTPTTELEEKRIAPSGVILEIAGGRWLAPLGELCVGELRVERVVEGESAFLVLRTPSGAARPILGEYELAASVELCHGDEIRQTRGGPVVLRVGGTQAGVNGGYG